MQLIIFLKVIFFIGDYTFLHSDANNNSSYQTINALKYFFRKIIVIKLIKLRKLNMLLNFTFSGLHLGNSLYILCQIAVYVYGVYSDMVMSCIVSN